MLDEKGNFGRIWNNNKNNNKNQGTRQPLLLKIATYNPDILSVIWQLNFDLLIHRVMISIYLVL